MSPCLHILLVSVLRVLLRMFLLHVLQAIGSGAIRLGTEEARMSHAHVYVQVISQQILCPKLLGAIRALVFLHLSTVIQLPVILHVGRPDHPFAVHALDANNLRAVYPLLMTLDIRKELQADVALAP